MIRMLRDGEVLRCSGLLEAVLPNTPEGWGQLSRAARDHHLMPAEVDKATGEFRYLPARRPQDSVAAWQINIDTQRQELAGALQRVARVRASLARLGVPVEGVALPLEPPTAAPSTPPRPAPPAAKPPRAAAPPTLPPEPEPVAAPAAPAPVPAPAPPPPDPLRDAVRELRDVAVRRKELYRVAVCTRLLDGAEAAAALTLPSATRTKVSRLSDAQVRAQCEQWVTESTPRASA